MTYIKTIIFITIISLHLISPTTSKVITCPSTSTECHCPTTSGETCIFNCTTEDSCKSTTLYCRPNDPCEIRCKSKAACAVSTTIQASQSTNVNLICEGEDTCKSSNILQCGTGDCIISCHGEDSCMQFGTINTTNARSFQCNGQCTFPNIPNYFSLQPTIAPTLPPTLTENIDTTIAPTSAPLTENIYTIIEAIITTNSATLSPPAASMIPMTSTIVEPTNGNVSEKSNFYLYSIENIHPLYFVIALLLLLIFIVCCILFCWVYVSHNHTQKLILAQKRNIINTNNNNGFDSTCVNFNPSKLNIPTSKGVITHCKSPTSSDVNNHIVTPSCTRTRTRTYTNANMASVIPKMYPVHSDNSTVGTPIGTLTVDTIELQQCLRNAEQIAMDGYITNVNHAGHTTAGGLVTQETTDNETSISDCNNSRGFDEGTGYGDDINMDQKTDGHGHDHGRVRNDKITMDNYYKNHLKVNRLIPAPPPLPLSLPHLPPPINIQFNNGQWNIPPPPPPLIQPPPPNINTLVPTHPQMIQLQEEESQTISLLPVKKSNIPPPPSHAHAAHNNDNINDFYIDEYSGIIPMIISGGGTDRQNTFDTFGSIENSDNNNNNDIDNSDLSYDTIMKHLNTMDSDFDGEETSKYSIKAVRHPTFSNGTYSYNCSPQINVTINTPDGMSQISLKKDNMIQQMENIKKEIYDIAEKLKFHNQPPQIYIKNNNNNNNNDSSFENKIEIEIPNGLMDNSKSFESYSLGNTPRPKDFSKDTFSNTKDCNDENDRNSYAIQLVAMDEPTYTDTKNQDSKTESTMVEDTYLKYLNM